MLEILALRHVKKSVVALARPASSCLLFKHALLLLADATSLICNFALNLRFRRVKRAMPLRILKHQLCRVLVKT
jgi:hypothetical protein